ncbi:twin-arginine translocation signal/Cys-rich four helix bundle protein [Leptospira inadai serovar Lyme str. 10]|uniref:Twin-arginine translocation signal/Cys-rich four helix bundle protein n=2 Tax=Leptospira inadai serovar Lyme TaxID=293084 RepID=V6HF00_9LEPT|nr:four-helix bundle copper-binding protein [Leptospira inadai]EQA38048.1 twin-arginine translocation signal/Cys-rich four helix bundle protein [Leptospira inadai serovar Lyme str. 10]PNV75650.1 four-helix bundle copper-binding protein [Leptospira inadai serovar Lyme]
MNSKLTRTEFFGAAGATLLTLGSLSEVLSQEHDHSQKKGHVKKKIEGKSTLLTSAILASGECVVRGELCIAMCIEALSSGKSELADCLKSVEETVALCNAFIKLGSLNSTSSKKIAAICLNVCESCAKQCDKHADHHEECKACADACKACMVEFKKLAA